MKNYNLKFKISLSIILLVGAVFVLSPGFLANDEFPAVKAQSGGFSGTGKEVFCRAGWRDWDSFLSSVASYDGFVEYWKDIIIRYNANICLYNDVDNLLKRLDKVRKQIRAAFYACDIQADNLRKSYYKLEAELYFVRKYINTANGNFLFENEKALRNLFIEYFVNDKQFFTLEENNNYFDEFLKRYKSRQEIYLNCKDPTWTNLIEKWNEFNENAAGFAAFEEALETVSKKSQKVLNTPLDRTGNLLGGFVDLRINDLEPEVTLSEIAANLKRTFPSGYTFEQLQTATDSEKRSHEENISREEFLIQYEHLYKESSGDIINEIVARLDYLDNTIRSTTANEINQTAKCTKTVIDKTC